ncbi:hypothetical protein BDF19DRAFT_410037 [Syncephalis fuscata]|nr:hypothetical protein BDF19DRAFT_410037 [Syncephalis fuscata]
MNTDTHAFITSVATQFGFPSIFNAPPAATPSVPVAATAPTVAPSLPPGQTTGIAPTPTSPTLVAPSTNNTPLPPAPSINSISPASASNIPPTSANSITSPSSVLQTATTPQSNSAAPTTSTMNAARNYTFPADGSCNLNLFEPYCPQDSVCQVTKSRTECTPISNIAALPSIANKADDSTGNSTPLDYCIVGQSPAWPIAMVLNETQAIQQGVATSSQCRRCPRPSDSTLVQQLVRKFGNDNFLDNSWSTFGNCNIDAFCGKDNICYARKQDYHGCNGGNQCIGGLCEANEDLMHRVCRSADNSMDVSVQQFLETYVWVMLAGLIISMLGVVICIMYRRRRKQLRIKHRPLETEGGNSPSKNAPALVTVGPGANSLRNRFNHARQWLNKDAHTLRVAGTITVSLGVFLILFSVLYPAFGTYAYSDDNV